MVARAGSSGGILAVSLGKFRNVSERITRSVSENKGEIRWQQARRETRNTGKEISE
jgi:hypothetical protein